MLIRRALPHIKGKWARAGGRLVLADWQVFILANVFGFVDAAGIRRYRACYIEVPRKNGKSTFTAAVGLYMLTEDNEPGAEIYSAATTRDQARIIFNVCRAMAKRSPGMRREYGVRVGAHALSVTDTESSLVPLSSDAHTLDGLNPSFAMIDELHAHKSRAVFDVLDSALGSRDQPVLWTITTAGTDRTGVCYEQRTYIDKILKRVIVDERVFGIVYTIDEDDDWTDEDVWAKANPNYDVSVNVSDMRRQARKAAESPSSLNNFLTKRLNVWTNAAVAWLDVRRWNKCEDPELVIADFEGRPCYLGVDLASTTDLCALAFVFPPLDESEKLAVFVRFYLPEGKIEEQSTGPLPGWEHEGWLLACPGDTVDFGLVDDDVREAASLYDVQAIGYDPWQAMMMATAWEADGLPAIEVPMRTRHLSAPMKELERLVLENGIVHDGNPVLAWNTSNVVATLDANDNVFPRKEKTSARIDGVVAIIIAMNRSMLSAPPATSVYETRGLAAI